MSEETRGGGSKVLRLVEKQIRKESLFKKLKSSIVPFSNSPFVERVPLPEDENLDIVSH